MEITFVYFRNVQVEMVLGACNNPTHFFLPVRAPGHLQLDLLAVFDVTFEGLIDQQSVTEDSTRPSFFEFEHAS